MSNDLEKTFDAYQASYSDTLEYHKEMLDEFVRLLMSLNTQKELIHILLQQASFNVLKMYAGPAGVKKTKKGKKNDKQTKCS